MKSYLGMIPISAKVHKRQNRMTLLCIVFAVFLVTAIFSVADMMIRTEQGFMEEKHGNWHIKLNSVTQDMAQEIGSRPDVAAFGISSVFNFNGEYPWYVNEKKAVLYGTEETCMSQIFDGITDGTFPQNDHEVMLSPNTAAAFQIQAGDTVTVHTPAGDSVFTVSGFGTDDKDYYKNQTYLAGVYMTRTAFRSLMEQNGITGTDSSCYVRFQTPAMAAEAMPQLQSWYQLPRGSIQENTGVMGMAGQSSNDSMKNIYGMAFVLFILVLMAGVLMISGSMNSNMAQRTQFFGMLRCIGATRQQIIRFVCLEALNWCKSAVPAGVMAGTAISWGICGALRYGIGGEFAAVPVFRVSLPGIVSGMLVGIITVILAAQSPARRAASVSPVSAVSGNLENMPAIHRFPKRGFGRIEITLGFCHAVSSKKNRCLMTASFSLTIILFFSFSVILDFAKLLLPSQAPTSADLVLNGYGNEKILDRAMADEIKKIEGVANAYGSCYEDHLPAASSGGNTDYINLVSYDDTLLNYARENVVQGDLTEIYGNSSKAATVFNKNNPLKVGDTIEIAGQKLEISCSMSQGLFGDDRIVICSQDTFDRLMGAENYILIGVQLDQNAAKETAAQIKSFENREIMVLDLRESNRQDMATYLASQVVVYGFLVIIGIITLFHMINSISMSVSARVKQYGIMRAVGMEGSQLTRIISAEAFTYAVFGLTAGLGIGVLLNRFLYTGLITRHFGIAWHFPAALAAIVVIFVFIFAGLAIYGPSKRLRDMAVTETINEL